MRYPYRLWVILVAALLLGGCSLARLGYGFAPTWFSWEIDRYLSLDRSQKAMVAQRLDELQQWHRHTQLPRYAGLLRELETEAAAGPLSVPRLAHWRAVATVELWAPMAERLAEPMAELLLSLRADQLTHFRSALAEANRKYRKDRRLDGSREALASARTERFVDRAEFFLGSLTRDQQRLLREQVEALRSEDETWYAEREARQQRMVMLMERVLADRPTKAVVQGWCLEYLKDPWRSPDAARRARMESSTSAVEALTARLLATASDRQRQHMADKFRDFAEQALALAAGS